MKVLMVQGTTSDAGKTTVVAGLCRLFSNQGVKVAPFKPQNMALNSAVTDDGGEIGRAQALQAYAARIPLSVDLNPILLKPNSDTGAQVIVHGKAIDNMEATRYHNYKQVAMQAVLTSHARLATQYELLLVEGAGSPAEINLRDRDIANMGYAEAVDCPVILVADIDKGGVFAHLVGTLALLSESEQQRIKGFIINRFRGDISLLQSGLDWLEERTGKPVLGVLPYIHHLALDAEDAIAHTNVAKQSKVKVAVLILPHVSNHTDFEPLALNPDVELKYIKIFEPMPACDVFILPGSKNVMGDLALIQQHQWPDKLNRHLRYGGKLLGICGGMQMMGEGIADPLGIESSVATMPALGLASFNTVLKPNKTLAKVSGQFSSAWHQKNKPVDITGYEIHCGVSTGPAFDRPLFNICDVDIEKNEGFISADQQIIGTYLHGIFDKPEAVQALLNWVNPELGDIAPFDLNEHREQQLEELAATFAEHLDMPKIQAILEQQ